jgi:hypothetical protein
MKIRTLYLLIALSLATATTAQTQTLTLKMGDNDMFSSLNNDRVTGEVFLIQDAAISNMLRRHALLNSEVTHIQGYRLQVFFSSTRTARQEAQNIKKNFENSTHNVAVYIEYNAPYWKVKIGDFVNKSDALRLKNELAIDFPNAWVIKEAILEKPDTEKDE